MQGRWSLAVAQACTALLVTTFPFAAIAQPPTTAGVVTQVQGRVDLTRQAATPVPLQFKDNLFLRDIVNTREESMARMLFGGRSSVTVRELTRFEVRSETLPTGGSKTIYDLSEGKIRVIVVPKLMRPGDEIEIRTPNAVAGIRGTVVVVERDRKTGVERYTAVSHCAVVTPKGRAPIHLCQGQRVAMTSTWVGPVETVSPAELAKLEAEFAMGQGHQGEANRAGILEAHVRTAGDLWSAIDGIVDRPVLPIRAREDVWSERQDIWSDPRQPDFVPGLPSGGGGGGGGGPKVPGPNIIVNPGFETGTLAGWTTFSQVGSSPGSGFTIYTGAAVLPLSGTAVLAPPPPGAFAAITDQFGPGSHALFQDVVIPVNGVLSFDLFINNQAGVFSLFAPPSLSFDPDPLVIGLEPNQQARVDLVNPAAPIQDVGAGVVRNLFQTNVGDPNVSGYNTFVFNVSAFAGQNLRLRFAEVDNQNLFQFGVDNVILVDPSFPGDLILQGSGSFRAISEPLVRLGVPLEVGTDPSIAADLLDIRDGGRIVMMSSAPVVLLEGGPVIIGTADATGFDSPNRLFHIRGANIDPTTGLGTDQPIIGNGIDPAPFPGATKPIGSLVEATNGTTITVVRGPGDTAGGNALYLDTALLEASAPILRLIGSPTAQTTLTTDGSAIELFKSAVTALGPVVALDRGLITVQNGPLIRLTDGSQMLVTGDLLSLINGSRINVLNGPLASVEGAGTLLSVSGALAHFGGTGGNQIVVNNTIAPTATLSGLPVSATTGGSIAIGPNPIRNPALGNVSVNGSIISATQGGTVNIAAP